MRFHARAAPQGRSKGMAHNDAWYPSGYAHAYVRSAHHEPPSRPPTYPPTHPPSHIPIYQAVYAMAFDKSGDFIASGALGGSLYVWSVKDGTIVRSFRESLSSLCPFGGNTCAPKLMSLSLVVPPPFPASLLTHRSLNHHRGRRRHLRNRMGPARRAAGGVLLDREGGGAGLPQNVVKRAVGYGL